MQALKHCWPTVFCFCLLPFLIGCTGNSGRVEYYYLKADESTTSLDTSASSFKEKTFLLNNGLDNGIYWLYLPARNFVSSKILQLQSEHLSGVECYQNGRQLFRRKYDRFETFEIRDRGAVFLKVNFRKDAFLPVRVYEVDEFRRIQNRQLLVIGLYYGIALTVILFNLLFFNVLGDRTFLYYSTFAFFVALGLFYSDGMFRYFSVFKNSAVNIEAVIHCAVAISGSLFAESYLQLDVHLSWVRKAAIVLIGILVCLCIAYLASERYIFFALIEVFTLVTLSLYWVAGVFCIRKSQYAIYFVFAYFIILVLALDYYLSKVFGFNLLNISPDMLKAGGVFEMVFLGYSVYRRVNELNLEFSGMKSFIVKYAQTQRSSPGPVARAEDLIPALRDMGMSQREIEIIRFLQEGKTNKEIATVLFLSVNTVKFHIKNIFEKLKISSRREINTRLGG